MLLHSGYYRRVDKKEFPFRDYTQEKVDELQTSSLVEEVVVEEWKVTMNKKTIHLNSPKK